MDEEDSNSAQRFGSGSQQKNNHFPENNKQRVKLTKNQIKEKISQWMRGHIRQPHKPRTFKEIVEFAVKNRSVGRKKSNHK